MKIIVDAFGGDNAPLEIIKGCAQSVAEFDDLSIILTGDEGKIIKVASDNNISLDRIEIHHCTEVITMDDHADAVLWQSDLICSKAVRAMRLFLQETAVRYVWALPLV